MHIRAGWLTASLLWSALTTAGVQAGGAFELSQRCPGSFERLENGSCELRSLYEFYDAPAGFGGLKAPLPEHRGHYTPLFTNQQLAVTGAPEYPGNPFDPGAAAVTGEAALRAAFKVPNLRNIALTAPYMHSGALPDLAAVVRFYNAERGHAVPADEHLTIHWHIVNPRLAPEEEQALIAFLETLTDETNKPPIPAAVPSGLPVLDIDARVVAGRIAQESRP